MKKACPNCKIKFNTNHSDYVYCSDFCRKETRHKDYLKDKENSRLILERAREILK